MPESDVELSGTPASGSRQNSAYQPQGQGVVLADAVPGEHMPASTPLAASSKPVPPAGPLAHSGSSGRHGSTAPHHGEGGDAESYERDYSPDHVAAVVRPVALTMALAAWVVTTVRDPAEDASIQQGLNAYLVYDQPANGGGGDGGGGSGGGDNGPTSTEIGEALINALVIVGVVCAATFVLVLCYKFRMLKLMVGYLMFASMSLLGYTGSFLVYTGLKAYRISNVDIISFLFAMLNFAVVGVLAIFYQKGIPRRLTQGYLVCVSVIMAWTVSKLPEWTSWALLVALALYDLCAVLTPCGPLRALINLAQEQQDPIPGLLYEATVGDEPRPDTTQQEGVRDTFVTGRNRRQDSAPAQVRPEQASTSGQPGTGAPTLVDSIPAADTGEHVAPAGRAQRAAVAAGTPCADQQQQQHEQPPSASAGANSQQEESILDIVAEAADSNIKLGLGDFVFYSVLVSRAALFDVTTVAMCFVGVLLGLGGTLILLTVFQHALPALPISIFLGVALYFWGRFVFVPYVGDLSLQGYTY